MDELVSRRINKMANSKDARPVDVLRAAANDIESGETKCSQLVIVIIDRGDPKSNDPWDLSVYRANMPRDEELVALELAKRNCFKYWLGDT